MDYANQRFENTTVTLDGNSYRDCVFDGVHIVYGGGEVNMSGCRLERFTIGFDGDLQRGLNTLHQLFGEGLFTILRGFVEPPSGQSEINL